MFSSEQFSGIISRAPRRTGHSGKSIVNNTIRIHDACVVEAACAVRYAMPPPPESHVVVNHGEENVTPVNGAGIHARAKRMRSGIYDVKILCGQENCFSQIFMIEEKTKCSLEWKSLMSRWYFFSVSCFLKKSHFCVLCARVVFVIRAAVYLFVSRVFNPLDYSYGGATAALAIGEVVG